MSRTGTDGTPTSYKRLQGVDRTLAVLEGLAERPRTATELAADLGLSWTTLYRTLATLHELGYVERSGSHYRVGMRLYALGSAYLPTLSLTRAARPYLHAAATVGQSVAQLIQRNDRLSVVLHTYEPKVDKIPDTSIGNNFPLHCGSKGHVLLAYAEPEFVESYLSQPLQALTPETLTDPDALRARLEDIRDHGYAVTERDVRTWSSSVAAPVFDRDRKVMASVTLVVPPADLRERRGRLIDLVCQTAVGIERSMRAL